MINDNEPIEAIRADRRKIRDSLFSNDNLSDLCEIIDKDGIKRISEARNESCKTSNLLMIVASAISVLYFLKLEGFAGNIKIGDYSLSSLPFGLFVLCLSSLVTSCVSIVRAGDSRAFDRLLKRSCEIAYSEKENFAYRMYPNEYAWGEPFQLMVHVEGCGIYIKLFRTASITFLNFFLLALAISPAVSGVDYLIHKRVDIDKDFQLLRWSAILFLTTTNILTFWLISWARMVDRD